MPGMSSLRILKESECNGCGPQPFETTRLGGDPAAIFMSPRVVRGGTGGGMRTLPRLSASQVVRNFRDIASDGSQGGNHNPKYRHVSHKDFNQDPDMKRGQKSFRGGRSGRPQMVASSDGLVSDDNTVETPLNGT